MDKRGQRKWKRAQVRADRAMRRARRIGFCPTTDPPPVYRYKFRQKSVALQVVYHQTQMLSGIDKTPLTLHKGCGSGRSPGYIYSIPDPCPYPGDPIAFEFTQGHARSMDGALNQPQYQRSVSHKSGDYIYSIPDPYPYPGDPIGVAINKALPQRQLQGFTSDRSAEYIYSIPDPCPYPGDSI